MGAETLVKDTLQNRYNWQEYELGRPAYPQAAGDFFCKVVDVYKDTKVVDLAAGTGRVTDILLPKHPSIIAVEPSQEMREIYSRKYLQIDLRNGSAEDIPLENESVDCVVIGNAFHLFNGERALKEIARILRHRGHLGMIWNMRDKSEGWVSELMRIEDAIIRMPDRPKGRDRTLWEKSFLKTQLFDPLKEKSFEFSQNATPEIVMARVFSSNFGKGITEKQKNTLTDRIQNLLNHHPDLMEKKQFPFPYRCLVHWTQKK
jgi:ubiquinone/menaquinone biosynthesis C-methylase UbiE